MSARQTAAFLFLAAAWGASFLFIRVAAPLLGPFVLMEARVVIAAAALWLFALARRSRTGLTEHWKALSILGLVHAAVPYVLIAAGEIHLTASMAAVLTGAAPLFAALMGIGSATDRPTGPLIGGLLFGLIGITAIVGWSPIPLDRSGVLAVMATLLAAASYAFGAIYAKRRLAGVPVLTLALGQQIAAGLWLALPAGLSVPQARITTTAVLCVVALALVSTALAYLAFFWLNAEIGPVRTSTVTYVIPLFGVVWGRLFLNEPLSGGMILGLALVSASLALVNSRAARRRLPEAAVSRPRPTA